MRASELLDCEVFTADGKKLGRVFDLEATPTGPSVNDVQGNALEVSHVLVGSSAFLLRLGYYRRDMRGPVGLRFLAHRLTSYKVPWEDIESIDHHRISLAATTGSLPTLD